MDPVGFQVNFQGIRNNYLSVHCIKMVLDLPVFFNQLLISYKIRCYEWIYAVGTLRDPKQP